MVTTTASSSQEVLDSFGKALAGIREVVAECDGFEEEVYELCRKAFVAAVEGLTPALKLVDKPLEGIGRGIEVKGLEPHHSIFLLRDGTFRVRWMVSNHHLSGPIESGRSLFDNLVYFIERGDKTVVPMMVIQEVLAFIQGLQEIIVEALEKNEARHEKLSLLLKELRQIGSPQPQPEV